MLYHPLHLFVLVDIHLHSAAVYIFVYMCVYGDVGLTKSSSKKLQYNLYNAYQTLKNK